MSIDQRLVELGIVLPDVTPPAGAYAKVLVVDGYAHLSGQGSRHDNGEAMTGIVPSQCSVEDAIIGARQCGLLSLSALKAEIGSLDRVEQVVRTLGMVNSENGFGMQPKVIDGFSKLMIEVFGEAGRGARSAVGVSSLPFDLSVEVEMTVKLKS